MPELVVIVPSRGRPHNMARLAQAFKDTGATARLVCCADDDDPTLPDYYGAGVNLVIGPRLGLAGSLNQHAVAYADMVPYVGFMGDDHLPRTAGWDKQVVEALQELGTGIVYCNDLLQGERLPTAVFVTSNIVRTLGYLCFPGAKHMYLDDCWLAWGQQIDRIRYLPDVIVEHMHPGIGKADHDSGYAETGQLMGPDSVAWEQYRAGRFADDVAKLRGLL